MDPISLLTKRILHLEYYNISDFVTEVCNIITDSLVYIDTYEKNSASAAQLLEDNENVVGEFNEQINMLYNRSCVLLSQYSETPFDCNIVEIMSFVNNLIDRYSLMMNKLQIPQNTCEITDFVINNCVMYMTTISNFLSLQVGKVAPNINLFSAQRDDCRYRAEWCKHLVNIMMISVKKKNAIEAVMYEYRQVRTNEFDDMWVTDMFNHYKLTNILI